MTRSLRLALLLALSLVLAPATRAADSAVPDMLGTWTGAVEGVVAGKGLKHQKASDGPLFAKADFTFTIEKQVGRAFSGKKSSGKKSEPVIGLIGEDGRSVWIVDEDVVTMATLVDGDTLQVLNLGAQKDHLVANQGKFTRAKAPPAR